MEVENVNNLVRKNKSVVRFSMISVIILVVLVLGVILYDSGYRLSGFSISKTGSISVTLEESGSWLFVGDKLQRISESESEEILVPNAPSGLGIDGSNGEQKAHLPRFEDPTLRINQRNTLALEHKPRPELRCC